MNNLFDYVYVENILTEKFCQEAIEHLNTSEWQRHTWYKGSELVDKNDFYITSSDQLEKQIRPKVNQFLLNYSEKVTPYLILHEISELRFNIYRAGVGLEEHVDHTPFAPYVKGQKSGIPILSMVGVLNDDYDGGEFILCGKTLNLKTGDLLAFPSVFLYPHSVNIITRGIRYSWVIWAY